MVLQFVAKLFIKVDDIRCQCNGYFHVPRTNLQQTQCYNLIINGSQSIHGGYNVNWRKCQYVW